MVQGIKGSQEKCSVENCDRDALTRGWCSAHYARWKKTGDVEPDKPLRPATKASECSVLECGREVFCKALCVGHYGRLQQKGDIQAHIPIGGFDQDEVNRRMLETRAANGSRKAKSAKRPEPRTLKECSVDECKRNVRTDGLCEPHYTRRRLHGDVFAQIPISGRSRKMLKKRVERCGVDGCKEDPSAKGFCVNHYVRFKKYGDPLGSSDKRAKNAGQQCLVDGCMKLARTKLMCVSHYMRWNRTGSTDPAPKKSPRSKINKGGYRILSGYRSHPNCGADGSIAEHRLVMSNILERPLKPGENVHHKSGVRLDNRPENLELWVINQPAGQRVGDLLAYAYEIIDTYGHQHFKDNLTDSVFGEGSAALMAEHGSFS